MSQIQVVDKQWMLPVLTYFCLQSGVKIYVMRDIVAFVCAVCTPVPPKYKGPCNIAQGKCSFRLSAWCLAFDNIMSSAVISLSVHAHAIKGYNKAGSITVLIAVRLVRFFLVYCSTSCLGWHMHRLSMF